MRTWMPTVMLLVLPVIAAPGILAPPTFVQWSTVTPPTGAAAGNAVTSFNAAYAWFLLSQQYGQTPYVANTYVSPSPSSSSTTQTSLPFSPLSSTLSVSTTTTASPSSSSTSSVRTVTAGTTSSVPSVAPSAAVSGGYRLTGSRVSASPIPTTVSQVGVAPTSLTVSSFATTSATGSRGLSSNTAITTEEQPVVGMEASTSDSLLFSSVTGVSRPFSSGVFGLSGVASSLSSQGASGVSSGLGTLGTLVTQISSLPDPSASGSSSTSSSSANLINMKFFTVRLRIRTLAESLHLASVQLHYSIKYTGLAGLNADFHVEMTPTTVQSLVSSREWQCSDVAVNKDALAAATLYYSFTYTLVNPSRVRRTLTQLFRFQDNSTESLSSTLSSVPTFVLPLVPTFPTQPYSSLLTRNGSSTTSSTSYSPFGFVTSTTATSSPPLFALSFTVTEGGVSWVRCYYVLNGGSQLSAIMFTETPGYRFVLPRLSFGFNDRLQYAFLYQNTSASLTSSTSSTSNLFLTAWTTIPNIGAATNATVVKPNAVEFNSTVRLTTGIGTYSIAMNMQDASFDLDGSGSNLLSWTSVNGGSSALVGAFADSATTFLPTSTTNGIDTSLSSLHVTSVSGATSEQLQNNVFKSSCSQLPLLYRSSIAGDSSSGSTTANAAAQPLSSKQPAVYYLSFSLVDSPDFTSPILSFVDVYYWTASALTTSTSSSSVWASSRLPNTRATSPQLGHLSPSTQSLWTLEGLFLDYTQSLTFYFVFGTTTTKCQSAVSSFSRLTSLS